MIFNFSNLTLEQKKDLCNAIYFECVNRKGEFEVEFRAIKQDKSYGQLKAIYKLFQLAQPHFQKWNAKVIWNLETIKEFAKAELGYTRSPNGFEISMMIKQSGFKPKDKSEKQRMVRFCKNIKQNISFADFTKEQAFNFAKEFEVWCQTPIIQNGVETKPTWSDVYLTNEEKEAYWASLEKMYKKEV